MGDHPERTISHELSHLALCKLSAKANQEEAFRFLDEGYVTMTEEEIAGNLQPYRNDVALPTAYAQVQFGTRIADMQNWLTYFGAPSLRPCQPVNWGAYDTGASFVFYLIERFGRETFQSLFRDIGVTRNLPTSIERVYKTKLQELENGWLEFVRGTKVVLPPRMPVQGEAFGFAFSPGRGCDNGWIGASWCESTEPKTWVPSEIEKVSRLLGAINEAGLPEFLKRIRDKGFTTLYRYGHGFLPKGNNQYAREEHGAWVWGRDTSINVSDIGFAFADAKDPVGGFDLLSVGLLHEMTHAFAFEDNVLIRDFALKAGWVEQNGKCFLAGVDAGDIAATVAQMRSLILAGKLEEALRLNREYGIEHGFPSAYAMSSPTEGIADVASHLHFDPNASTYMKPELIQWIKDRVLQ